MRVSVVIPTFNRRRSVRRAVASVLAQRAVAVEIIVVDDGSSDGTAVALDDEFGSSVTILVTPNHGVSAARNRGAAAATCEWLAFLDSDDEWLPHKLERQMALLGSRPELAVCHSDEIWMRDGRRVNPRRRHRKPVGRVLLDCLPLCVVSASTVVLRRSLLLACGGFDAALPVCEDYDMWLRLAARAEFGFVAEALSIRHGGHADQLSRRFWGMDRFRVAALAKLLDSGVLAVAERAIVAAELRHKCAVLAGGARRRGRSDEAARYGALAEHYACD